MIPCLNGATSRPYPLEDDMRAASAAGFPMIELWSEKFDDYFAKNSVDDLKRQLDEYALQAAAIDLVALDYGSPAGVEVAVEQARELGKIAQTVGCDLLLFCSWGDLHGRSKEEGIELIAQYMKPVCQAAAEYDCRLAIEPLGQAEAIPGSPEALQIIDLADEPNLGLMWDFFHYYKSEVPLESIRQIPLEKLWLVHVDDAPDLPPPTLTDPDRVYPGLGVMPLPTYFDILQELGYDGVLSVELFNQDYYKRPIEEITQKAFDSLQPYLQSMK